MRVSALTRHKQNFRLELMAVKAIQLGQVWREETSGQSFLVTKLYNEVFSQFAMLRPADASAPSAETRRVKVAKTPQGLLLPGYVFTQDPQMEF
jgi:hypothetical protein